MALFPLDSTVLEWLWWGWEKMSGRKVKVVRCQLLEEKTMDQGIKTPMNDDVTRMLVDDYHQEN